MSDLTLENKELLKFLGDKFSNLSQEKQNEVAQEYSKRRKTSFIFFCWFFNFHYIYVERWWLFLLFFFSLGGIAIWWVIDLFRLDTILEEYNRNLAEEILNS